MNKKIKILSSLTLSAVLIGTYAINVNEMFTNNSSIENSTLGGAINTLSPGNQMAQLPITKDITPVYYPQKKSALIKDHYYSSNFNNLFPIYDNTGTIEFYVANNKDRGLIIYDNNYNVYDVLSEQDFIQHYSSDYQSFLNSIISYENIVPSSDGKSIYILVIDSWSNNGATSTEATTSEMYKYDFSSKKLGACALSGSVCNAITMGIIPDVDFSGVGGSKLSDDLIDFGEDINPNHKTEGKIVYQNSDLLGCATNATKFYTKFIDTSVLFNLPKNYNVAVQDFFISKTPTANVYEMNILGRSFDDAWKNKTVFNQFTFTLDSKVEIKVKDQLNTIIMDNWDSSDKNNKGNLSSPLLYNHFSANKSEPNYFATYIKQSEPNSSGDYFPQKTSIDVYDNTKSTIKETAINIDNNARGIESDISNDGQTVYYLQENDNKIRNNKNYSIALTNKIDNDYILPQSSNNQIQGFSWTDKNKNKMVIFDSNGMVSQYNFDGGATPFTLLKGVEFENDSGVFKTLDKPSDLTNDNISQFIKIKGYNSLTNIKYKINYNDSIDEVTVSFDDTLNGKTQNYSFNHAYNWDQSKNGTKSNTNLYIIIGASVAAVVVILIIAITSYVILKKKRNLNTRISRNRDRDSSSSRKTPSKKRPPSRRR